ncbi:MAG: Mrp/NBP35 family ATP-binding protein [Alistipes sp.]|jgi:ATP-binding protein involved in chromosome partitioning|nr:Mrp/NBP35 family ATP-binding protein [Alistipes sp.]
MINKNSVEELLDTVIHPESGHGLHSGGFVNDISVVAADREDSPSKSRIEISLKFRRPREPFAASLRRRALQALGEAFPDAEVTVEVVQPAPKTAVVESEVSRRLPGVNRVVAVASGKGGVGKSTVAANLAVALAESGFRVGVLDADIHGPSQPALFGVEGYQPPATGEGADALIEPAFSRGVKIMSIGFFIGASDALVWRGPMAVNALRQLVRQTAWGELDYLLIDLPPGTGDVLLSVAHELAIDGAVVVSTPGELAIADVRRGVKMFRTQGIDIPLLGIVENMSWFSPAELPDNRYYVFGRGGVSKFAQEERLDILGEIPLVLQAMAADGFESENTTQSASRGINDEVKPYYTPVAKKIVDKLSSVCWKP